MADPHRDLSIPIGHMLDAIAGVRATAGLDSAEVLRSDWTRLRAIERGFEIISDDASPRR